MKDIPFTIALKQVIEEDLRAIDEIIAEDIDVLADIGNPEKLIGKKYEEWTPQDLQMLMGVYGDKLDDFRFNKDYKRLLEIEEA